MQAKALLLVAGAFGAFVVGACSDASDSSSSHRVNSGVPGAPGGPGGAGGAGASGPAGPACPSGVAAPSAAAQEPDVADLALAGGILYFRAGNKIVKINKDGSGRADVYTSKNLVRAYTDGSTFVAVESPNPPNAELKLNTIGAAPDTAQNVGTDLVAAGTSFFGSDADNTYAVGQKDQGDALYRVAKKDAGGMEEIATTEGVVTDPQVSAGALWYVLDQSQVYKLPTGADKPALVATVEGGCRLAVGAARFYCTTKGAVDARDLAGGAPQKIADATTSKVPISFGAGIVAGDALVVRSAGDGPLKNVIRVVGPGAGDERIVACGRDTIGTMVADDKSVAWIEPGKGVFVAPR